MNLQICTSFLQIYEFENVLALPLYLLCIGFLFCFVICLHHCKTMINIS